MHTHSSPIPTRLLVPGVADSIRRPVSQPRAQQLPVDELSFDNFQRLSVRLLTAMKDAIHCQEYGTPGQKQEGIDLYARIPGQCKIEVWQCKRYDKFTASDVEAAVVAFLNGKLVADTAKFVLVTSAATEDRSLADADLAAAKELQVRKIEFVLMGRTSLTTELKAHPEIIDDFFGRDWVEVCCGLDAAKRLGQRLSAHDVTQYRKKLGNLYTSVFEQADLFLARSLTAPAGHTVSLPLSQRWVMPTISCRVESVVAPQRESPQKDEGHEDSHNHTNNSSAVPIKPTPLVTSSTSEMSAETFLGSIERGVVLGDPGSGKSTLLRVIALDLLSDNPFMRLVVKRFGNRLPVWLPFAFLSLRVSAGDSVADAASAWIRKNGGDTELEQLLRRAIGDDRLLLLIDGLDEWSDPDRARETVVAIQGFLSQHPAGCFATARPLGYERLDRMSGDWKHGRLQSLSSAQRASLATIIFNCVRPDSQSQVQQVEVERFIRQLHLEEALDEMASTPLMLVGLLSLWIQNKSLPGSRLAVCEALVKEMMDDHPSRRASISASIPTLASISSQIRRGALASLAWSIHTSVDGVSLERKEAEICFSNYFRDSEGMTLAEAKSHGRQMLPISDQIIGVLSEASPGGDVQFVHRTFQELLAAEHLSSLSIEDQVKHCADHACDPVWHQILLFLIQKNNRPLETDRMIHALNQSRSSRRDSLQAKRLLAEAVFSQVRMSPTLRGEHASNILDEIELGTWMPFREALLSKVLLAPPGSNVYTLLIKRLNAWIPKPGSFFVHDALANWPEGSGAESAIWSLINHEDVYDQLRAAKSLARRCKGQDEWGKRLLARLHEPLSCEALGACLVGLANGWFHDVEAIKVFEQGKEAKAPEIVLPSILGLVRAGLHDKRCKEQLLKYGDTIWFSDVAVEAALKGWPGDSDIKEVAVRSISERYNQGKRAFRVESAWQIAIEGYPGDDDVATAIAAGILKNNQSFCHEVSRKSLLDGFSGHPTVVAACEECLKCSDKKDVFESSLIAALSKTADSKKLLINWTITDERMGFHAARGLLWAWGSSDPEVAITMEQVRQNDALIRTFAFVLASTDSNKDYSRKKLLRALKGSVPDAYLNVAIIDALSDLRTEAPDNEVVEAALRCFEGTPELLTSQHGGYCLIEGFGDHPKVRELADKWMEDIECNWGIIAKTYSRDIAIQDRVKRMCRCQPDALRLQIMYRCRQRAAYDPEFRSIAEEFKLEENADVRMLGAVAVAESMMSLNENTSQLANYFAKETTAVGMQYEARTQAGIAGLIALNRVNMMLEQNRFNKKLPSIHFSYSRSSKILPQFLVKNWKRFKNGLGDKVWGCFQSDHELDTLRGVADELGKTEIMEEISSVLRGRTTNSGPNLSFLASDHAPGWVDACFTAMGLTPECNGFMVAEAHEASSLLAKYGASDDSIKVRLEELLIGGHTWRGCALETLARGWPNSAVLRSIWEKTSLASPNLMPSPMLIATYASSQQFISWLSLWLEATASASSFWDFNEDRWFVMRRCFEDTEVAALLLQRLKDSDSPNEWVSFPWLVRSSSLANANHEVRAWAEQLWKASAEKEWCIFGFDLFKCEYVPLKETLLELLVTDRRYVLR